MTSFFDVTLIVPLVVSFSVFSYCEQLLNSHLQIQHISNEIFGGRFGSSRVEFWNKWNEVLEAGNRLRSKESLKLPAVPESKLKATKAKLLAHPENLRR